jgi:ribosomal protein S16
VVEYVGSYDARKGKPEFKAERVKHWLKHGAKASDTVHNLLVDAKIVSGKKVNAMNKKTKPKKEEPKEEVKTPAAPAAEEAQAGEAPAA